MKLSKKNLTVIILGAVLILGALVLIFKKDYTFTGNSKSNAEYYKFLED